MTGLTGGDPRLFQLRQAASAAAAAGRWDDAARLWQQFLTLAPGHCEALHFLGQRALQRGDVFGARQLFEQANPPDPMVLLGLAFACRQLGDDPCEMAALTTALTLDPYCYPALLAKGASFERHGLRRRAAQIYKDALKIVPPDERLSPALRADVVRARAVVQQSMVDLDAFLETKLSALRAQHASSALARIDVAKEAMVGRSKIYTSEASLLRLPQLPAVPFFDRAHFPWLAALEAKTDIIRAELAALLQTTKAEFAPYLNYPADAPLEQWVELNGSPRWTSLYLWKDGARIEKNCALCPGTVAALADIPLASIPGGEPLAMFSALEPHTHIPPHTGITNARSVVHLPLILPGQCRFRVGHETREWKLGEAWVFDDSIEHEAFNDSDELRVILIFNVWNPYLSQAEQASAAALIAGYYDYLNADLAAV
ncbi:MAG: aspartyl/asparaginyl beta-hydroxylase domain-containing protein [Rhizomicrobium sp.]|nr:aspartyl/asparaginyl beta-hydroxylase domain-containing protein [Rhizomicrobium sp.]